MRLIAEISAEAAAHPRQGLRQARQPAGLALLANLVPIRMVAVLQPARGIATDRLQMCRRILGVAHIAISGRHRKARQPANGGAITDRPAAGREINPALAAATTADRQLIGRDVAQPEPLGERAWRRHSGDPRYRRDGWRPGAVDEC